MTSKSKIASVKAARAREEKCVDRWLAGRKLDPYGMPEGTMYAGGTPLFDEATGRQIDRLDYIYGKHPEAKTACAPVPKARSGGRPTCVEPPSSLSWGVLAAHPPDPPLASRECGPSAARTRGRGFTQ